MLNIKTLQDIMRTDAGVVGDAQRMQQIIWILFLKLYDFYEKNQENSAIFSNTEYKSIIPEKFRWRNWAKAYEIQDGREVAKTGILTGDALLNFVNNELFPALKEDLIIYENTPLNKAIVKKAFEDTYNYMKDGVLLRQLINEIDKLEIKTKGDRDTLAFFYESFLKTLQSAGNAGEFYTPRALTEFIMEILEPKIGDKIADLACGTGGFLISAYHYLDKEVQSAQDREILNQSFYGIEKKSFPFILCATNFLINNIDNFNLEHANSFDTKWEDLESKYEIIAMNPPYGGSENETTKLNFPTEFRSSETADLFMAMITKSLKNNGKAAVVLPDGFLFGNDAPKIALKKLLLEKFNLHLILRLPKTVFSPYTNINTNVLFFNKTNNETQETWFYRLDMPKNYVAFSKTKPMKLEHFQEFREWNKNRTVLEDEQGNPKAKLFTKAELIAKNYNFDLCGFIEAKEEILPPFELMENFLQEQEEIKKNINDKLNEIRAILSKNA